MDNEANRQFLNGIREGSVLEVRGSRCRVESGGLTTDYIQWFVPMAGESIEWSAPSEGESVVLICPSGDPAQGLALRGYYSDDFPAPTEDPNKHLRVYKDGASIEYDMSSHTFTITLPGGGKAVVNAPDSATVNTKTAAVHAETITLDGDTTCTKSLTVQGPFAFEDGMNGKGDAGNGKPMKIAGGADFDGEVKSQGISLPHHTHKEQGDGNDVSEPK
jgi:phage baseplate assembly protein V